MLNQLLLGTIVVMTLFTSTQFKATVLEKTEIVQAITQVENIEDKENKENKEKDENQKEEKASLETLVEEWEEDLPEIEEESPEADFINEIAPAAVIIAYEHGIYPSVMLAQAGLESDWGRSELAKEYNNLMGTKGSWEGKSVEVKTREDIDGESIHIDAGFSVYDSWTDSLYRYGSLMKGGLDWNEEYYKGTWRDQTDDYKEATAWLQDRYASDTNYTKKLNKIIKKYKLDQFDQIKELDEDTEKLLVQLDR